VLKKLSILSLGAVVAVSVLPMANMQAQATQAAQPAKFTIAFVPGVNPDPFYITMASGVNQAAADLGVTVVEQDPAKFDPTVQTPILDALIARGDINLLITAPTDKQQMIPELQKAQKAGIPVLTVDTFVGDGDYVNGPVNFPISYVGSDNYAGGQIACNTLADKLPKAAKIYIQNVQPGISTTDQREQGCKDAAKARGLVVVATDYNKDSADTAQSQTAAALQANPDIAGVFGTNTFGAQGAGTAVANAKLSGTVQVVAFDASSLAIELLKKGTVTQVIAQKPYDMGYLSVAYGVGYLKGFQSIPKRIGTGYAVLDKTNVDKPEFSRFIYSSDATAVKPPLGSKFNVAFVPGVNPDPFYITMAKGVNAAASAFGVTVVEQDPAKFDPTVQTPILDALIARGDINALVTAPTDKQQMIPELQKADKAGIPVITVDTFIGNGDYAAGPVTFPISYIGSDNTQGGTIACNALAAALPKGAKIYIQNVQPGISTTDQREQGCKDAAKAAGLIVVATDYNKDSADTAQSQTSAALQANPDIGGVFGTNTFGAQGAGTAVANAKLTGTVQVAAFDASSLAIELLKKGTVSIVIAQKPADMGYFGIVAAVANARGVTSTPKRWPTGYALMTQKNISDPNIAKFIYQAN